MTGFFHRAWRKLRRTFSPRPEAIYPMLKQMRLSRQTSDGTSLGSLRSWLSTVRPDGASTAEMAGYFAEAFERVVWTWDLVREQTGRCLELGANPYFCTMLLKKKTSLELTLANYFGPNQPAIVPQRILYHDDEPRTWDVLTHHFNLETEPFPFDTGSFDVVLFCEILEHLQNDPWQALLEIRRVLKVGGLLMITTPNVARLENVAKMLAGQNLYDPFSGYGPYGRHNREYTMSELVRLTEVVGFDVEAGFTADVHDNAANCYTLPSEYRPMISRQFDLGQYLFLKVRRADREPRRRPGWLYRSYPTDQLDG